MFASLTMTVCSSNRLSCFNKVLVFTSFIGFLLSCYCYYVEIVKESNPDYKALCDISEHMSCSKAFMSEYGKGFGVIRHVAGEKSVFNQPNCLFGIAFYAVLILLTLSSSPTAAKLQVILSVFSNIFSAYLAYVLYFILNDFCVVCVATYIVNLVNLVVSLAKYNRLKLFYKEKQKST